MKTLTQIKQVIKKYKKEIIDKYYVKEIAVFGSYVRGEQKKKSDLDILVEFKRPIGLFEFIDLESYLKKIIGIKIDLVSKKGLKPAIGKHILEERSVI